MEVVHPLITEEQRREEYGMVLRLYASRQVFANPVVMEALDGVGRPTGYLLWDLREDWVVALHWVDKWTKGKVKVSRRGESGIWTFGPVLKRHPGLYVETGSVRLLPVRVVDGGFLVDLLGTEVVGTAGR
jgi:hypothetical protein